MARRVGSYDWRCLGRILYSFDSRSHVLVEVAWIVMEEMKWLIHSYQSHTHTSAREDGNQTLKYPEESHLHKVAYIKASQVTNAPITSRSNKISNHQSNSTPRNKQSKLPDPLNNPNTRQTASTTNKPTMPLPIAAVLAVVVPVVVEYGPGVIGLAEKGLDLYAEHREHKKDAKAALVTEDIEPPREAERGQEE